MNQPSTVSHTTLGERYSTARSALINADPVMARLIHEHPDFDPRAFLAQLPKMDAFGTLLFLGYGLAFMIAGRLDNFYWGMVISPTMFIGLAFVPMAIKGLGSAAK